MSTKPPKVLREAGARYRGEQNGRKRSKRMTRAYTVVLHWLPAAGRYEVDIPATPNVLTAGTPSIAGSLKRANAALAHHLEWLLEDGETLPPDRPWRRAIRKGTVVETVKINLPRQ